MSSLGKVYTNILNRRMTAWAEKEQKIIEDQAGFRRGYSTVDHIIYVIRNSSEISFKEYKVICRICGFQKSF